MICFFLYFYLSQIFLKQSSFIIGHLIIGYSYNYKSFKYMKNQIDNQLEEPSGGSNIEIMGSSSMMGQQQFEATKINIQTQRTRNDKQSMKEQIILQNQDLTKQIAIRSEELHHLIAMVNHIKQIQRKIVEVQTRSLSLQSQLDDLQKLKERLSRELRNLSDQEQITKGRVIIEYNQTLEIRQQQQVQEKNKLFLEKHLEQIKKGCDSLSKKIKLVKEEIRRNQAKPKIDKQGLKIQLKDLITEYEKKSNRYEKVMSVKQNNYVENQIYTQLLDQQERSKKQALRWQELHKMNNKLVQEKQTFEERIKFLKNVDKEFLNEKKALLNQLKEKYQLHLEQNKSINKEFQQNQANLVHINNGSHSVPKKVVRKKEGKVKISSVQVQVGESEGLGRHKDERQGYRWKGTKLKKMIISMVVFLLMMGVMFSHLMTS